MSADAPRIALRITTVTLNPALDLTIPLARLALGEVNRAGPAELRPAGKGVNVAVMLAVLGEPVRATGLLGLDLPAVREADVSVPAPSPAPAAARARRRR